MEVVDEKADFCENCGRFVQVGDWPFCPHGSPSPGTTAPFVHYFDIGLGKEVTSIAERKKFMRGEKIPGTDRYRHRLEPRGKKVGDPGCEI